VRYPETCTLLHGMPTHRNVGPHLDAAPDVDAVDPERPEME